MKKSLCTIFIGTGSYIPETEIPNNHFLNHHFYTPDRGRITTPASETIEKFREITGIEKRRYAESPLCASDLGYEAAKKCLENSNINTEEINYIIVAHNFGDINPENMRTEQVPSLAVKIKGKLGIKNRRTECLDIPFGCSGWVQGVILADRFFKAGAGKKALIIGTETLSKVSDPYDRDSMIYADGAGATLVEAVESEKPIGILSYAVDCGDSTTHNIMRMGTSYGPEKNGRLFFKMDGHEVFKYGVMHVPRIIKESLDNAGLKLGDIKKILIHQANQKMDDSIVKRLFKRFYDLEASEQDIKDIMPMTISQLGNTSVATIPTLFDLVMRGKVKGHELKSGDNIVFASIGGGGPNVNSVVYRMP